MEIGEKIRAIRTAKHVTQSELAGDQITRNMLSLIENGSALPSLPTVMYIAERLEVPVGMLLAGEEEEQIYHKINKLPRIKQAFSDGEYKLCADMCLGLLGVVSESSDDELLMILAECHFGIAVEEFNSGKLHVACNEFDEACSYAKQTIYNCEHILCSVAIYFDYMRRLSPTLTSEGENETYSGSAYCVDAFGKYVAVIDALEKGNSSVAEEYVSSASSEEKGFRDHIKALLEIRRKNHREAKEILSRLIGGDYLTCRAITYRIFADLEDCCREIGDYKSAYEYSVGKVELLEYMLKY